MLNRRTFLKNTMGTGALAIAAGAGLLAPAAVLAGWNKAGFDAKDLAAAMSATGDSSDAFVSKRLIPREVWLYDTTMEGTEIKEIDTIKHENLVDSVWNIDSLPVQSGDSFSFRITLDSLFYTRITTHANLNARRL